MYDTPEFQSLRREYVQGVLERCAALRAEAARLRAGDPVDLRPLRQEVHKLRGSGGFYGFTALSGAAATAEDAILLTIDGETALDAQRIAALVDAVVREAEAAGKELGL